MTVLHYSYWCACMLQPLEAINNYEFWKAMIFQIFWISYRDFLAALYTGQVPRLKELDHAVNHLARHAAWLPSANGWFFMHDLKRSKLWFKFPWVCDCVDLVACITLCTKYLMLFGASQWHTEPGINKSVLSLIPRLSTWRCPLPSSDASGRYWSIAISRYVAPTAVNRYLPPAPKMQHISCMWRGCSYRSAGQTDTVR